MAVLDKQTKNIKEQNKKIVNLQLRQFFLLKVGTFHVDERCAALVLDKAQFLEFFGNEVVGCCDGRTARLWANQ